MLALYDIVDASGHVVSEVVKAKFVVGSESDVGKVGLSAALRIGLVLIDAIDTQTVEFI